ncbi:DUF4214 domain-containing protein [Roseomonas sp. BN140053]|uniref:DUF4214 domain-containing protein n=1 Tax=Roseomonas sp. BN140053 TaxID=3391898 RepID=UPI0039E875E5
MTLRTVFRTTNSWDQGFTGEILVINDGPDTVTGWTVSFSAPWAIQNFWNVTPIGAPSGTYSFSNVGFNGTLAPGQSANFGFNAAGAPSSPVFLDNGAPISGLPELTISDAAVTEGHNGTTPLTFNLSLSHASDTAVTVRWDTAAGSATPGVDFQAAGGTVTFAPGQTQATVQVQVLGDTAAENNETVRLVLSSPSGARPTRYEATGTIRDDDGGTLPAGQNSGFLSTRGADIVDASGTAVRLAAVNWFGLETTRGAPDGLNVRNWQDMMKQMADLGFNAIRLPYSSEVLHGLPASGISTNLNPDLAGVSGLALMDKIVNYAGQLGMKIILDHHRSSAGDGPNLNGLWYDGQWTEQGWIDDWKMLAQHYAGNTTVVGADLHNEPREQATWGDGNLATDWEKAAERAGAAIQSVNPDWLIVVEGITRYENDWYWQGGNLQGVREHPVDLPIANKLVYSPHDYPNSVYAQPWFQAANFGDTLQGVFDKQWAYIAREGIAPILVGELGTKLEDPKDSVWLREITQTLNGDFDGNGVRDAGAPSAGISWAWWSWNPNSGDTGGILQDDWRTPVQAKLDAIVAIRGTSFTSDGVYEGAEIHLSVGLGDHAVFDESMSGLRGSQFLARGNGDTLFIEQDGTVHALRNFDAVQFADGRMVIDPTDPASQVVRLYNAALARSPEQAGLNFYIDKLQYGAGLADIATGFNNSPEFQARFGNGLSNDQYVVQLYQNVLHRGAAESELSYYRDQFAAGQSREQTLVNFSESPENQRLTAATVQGGIWDISENAATVARIYDAAFGRKPDLPGLGFYRAQLDAGNNSETGIITGFLNSPEFQARYGANTSSTQFVELLYQNTLHRTASAEEVHYYTVQLDAGVLSRPQAVANFSDSPEHVALTADNIISETPSQFGIAFA